MRLASVLVSLSCALVAAGRAVAQPAPPSSTLPAFVESLDRLRAAVDALDERQPQTALALLPTVPGAWTVAVDGRTFEIKAEWLRRDLADWSATPDRALRHRLALRLAAVRADAIGYLLPARDVSSSRRQLNEILAAREFAGLRGPSWFDRLQQRVLRWFVALLGRALGSSAIPSVTTLLVYSLIGLVVVLAALWVRRALRRSAVLDSIAPRQLPRQSRPWAAWFDEARLAAARQDWNEAVHFTYWCAIAFLEDRGAWRPDRSRTPREYARLVPASSDRHPPLQALTRQFERVWYGAAPADAASFGEALAQLERLGCPPR